MILKLLAFIYRHTGYYAPYATRKEQEYIQSKEADLKLAYDKLEKDLDEMSFEDFKGIHIGLWQMKHGFYRTSKQFIRSVKKEVKKVDRYEKK